MRVIGLIKIDTVKDTQIGVPRALL